MCAKTRKGKNTAKTSETVCFRSFYCFLIYAILRRFPCDTSFVTLIGFPFLTILEYCYYLCQKLYLHVMFVSSASLHCMSLWASLTKNNIPKQFSGKKSHEKVKQVD